MLRIMQKHLLVTFNLQQSNIFFRQITLCLNIGLQLQAEFVIRIDCVGASRPETETTFCGWFSLFMDISNSRRLAKSESYVVLQGNSKGLYSRTVSARDFKCLGDGCDTGF
jgi:hypothetical protein